MPFSASFEDMDDHGKEALEMIRQLFLFKIKEKDRGHDHDQTWRRLAPHIQLTLTSKVTETTIFNKAKAASTIPLYFKKVLPK